VKEGTYQEEEKEKEAQKGNLVEEGKRVSSLYRSILQTPSPPPLRKLVSKTPLKSQKARKGSTQRKRMRELAKEETKKEPREPAIGGEKKEEEKQREEKKQEQEQEQEQEDRKSVV